MSELKCDVCNIYAIKENSERLINMQLSTINQVSNAKWIIPNYQRLYRWEKKDFNSFTSALSELLNDSSKKMYFGQLIVFLNEQKEFEIVDGQQRLTTFMILACILLEDKELDQYIGAHASAIYNYVYLDKEGNRRFEHQKMNEKYMNEYVFLEKPDVVSNHKLIIEAYESFQNHGNKELYRLDLKTAYSSRKTKDKKEHYGSTVTAFNELYNWYYKEVSIMQKLTLLNILQRSIEVSHLISTDFTLAYESFLSLNSKGRSLSNYDLIKSIFVGSLNEHTGDDTRWEKDIDIAEISETKIVDMLDIMLRIEYNDYYLKYANKNGEIKKNNLHSVLKQIVAENNEEDFICTLYNLFIKYVNTYVKLRTGAFSSVIKKDNFAKYNGSIRSLLAMDYIPFLPIFFELISSDEIDDEDILNEIIQLAKYAPFIYVTVCGQKPDALTKLTSQYIRNVNSCEVTEGRLDLICNLKSEFIELIPSINFKNELTYKTKLTNVVSKDILMLLETHLTSNDAYDNHLEHIYPQKATKKKWPQFEGDKEYVPRIGNHVIIPSTLNKKMGNKSFDEKLVEMKKAKKSLHKFIYASDIVKNYSSFDKKDVDKRGKEYSKLIEKIFIEMNLLKESEDEIKKK